MRRLTLLDRVITNCDRTLRVLTSDVKPMTRPSPGLALAEAELSDAQKQHARGLMRVNHTGEICAQALYQGQAITANLPSVRREMELAADEEVDHLAWCETRVRELGGRPSIMNPLFYVASFGLGAGAGLISDRVSLGFVAATEERVCSHLDEHLEALPITDEKSRAIVTQMRIDEEIHGRMALEAGGYDFPKPIKAGMTAVAKVMTTLAYRV